MININKILQTVKQIGGRYIFGNDSGDEFVIMTLDDFQKLHTDNTHLSNISQKSSDIDPNKEIAEWRADNIEKKAEDSLHIVDFSDNFKDDLQMKLNDTLYYFDPSDE